jgi:CIC family chloride channel protein
MGATIAHFVGRLFRRCPGDCLTLLAAGAGAGLATAFSAPIAGAVFVLEELVRRFDTRSTIATFGASAAAIAVARLLLGQASDFQVEPLAAPAIGVVPIYLALGLVAGLLGVAYNRAILGALGLAQRLHRWPIEMRAGLIGAAVGLLAWYWPAWVGGGEALAQKTLAGRQALNLLPLIFLLRFALGAVSYAAATPGGLFAPMLVLGSQMGLYLGTICEGWLVPSAESPTAFAVAGMAAFFTAVVRAPLTGIILVIEMTGGYTQLLPMLAACFIAMLVPALLRDPPIYDSLRRRTTHPGDKP